MGQSSSVWVRRGTAVCVVSVAAWGGSSAAAQGLLGQFEELSASFNAESGQLAISAVNGIDLQSFGYVREMQGPGRTAMFGAGFVAEPNPASLDALFTLTNIGEASAEVTGQIVITDVDGDTITLGVDHAPLLFGQGDANVDGISWWVALKSDESFFDGPDGGQVSTGYSSESAILLMSIARGSRDGSGLFHSSFADGQASTFFAIPSPGGAALVALAGVAAARRRRPRCG